jgi:hypothetical protein
MAREFFDQVRNSSDPITLIQGLVNPGDPTFETDWLDFKEQPTTNLQDPKWRSMWIEALAGFANNQGGVVVWGIEARKDPITNLDVAIGIKPINNPLGVKSRLAELQRQATDPPLGNVEIEPYESPSAPGTGFVVCFVPEGPYKPYRAEFSPSKAQYIIRAGDNFVTISRSVLASMFYPKSLAVFKVKASLGWSIRLDPVPPDPYVISVQCTLEILNEGTSTAKSVFAFVDHTITGTKEQINFASGLWNMRPGQRENSKVFATNDPIHPRQPTLLFHATWSSWANCSRATNDKVVPIYDAPSFRITIYCENQEPQVIQIRFDTDEMRAHRDTCIREAKAEDTILP